MDKLKFNTLMIHAGQTPDSDTGSRIVPIYQTTAYQFQSSEHARKLFALEEPGNIYTRLQNPTQDVLEQRMTALEDGVGALALASGHSAIVLAILNIAQAGDEIVSSNSIYGGAINMLGITLKKIGIDVKFVNCDDPQNFEKAITEKTKAIFLEAVGNPNANIADLTPIGEIAKKHQIPFIVDSTFTTPYLLQAKKFGANIVIHSATKYLGGHGTSMGGVVTDLGNFDWTCGKFPEFTQPDESYHGIVYTRDCGSAAYITKLRTQMLRDYGPAISPFNAFMIIQGIETLSLRMERHVQNADMVATFLEHHPNVSKVNYPRLKSSPYYDLAMHYLPKGCGSVFTFELKGDRETGKRFIDALTLFSHVANVGDVRSLVVHPASTTHSQLTQEQLVQAGISEGTVRLSVGIEDIDDIIADLTQAIAKATS